MAHHPHTTSHPTEPEPVTSRDRALWRYSNSGEAQRDVQDDYEYWTGKLTDLSFQLSLAIIGANWAAFGNLTVILQNPWAKASLASIIVGIAVNLLGTKVLGELLGKRLDRAKADPHEWEKEYEEYKKASKGTEHWPFTAKSDALARFLREVKTWAPLLAGALFLIGLFATHTREAPGSQRRALAPGTLCERAGAFSAPSDAKKMRALAPVYRASTFSTLPCDI